MRIEIPGKPIAKARPRFARRGKYVTTFNPQESEDGKWVLLAMSQVESRLNGPVVLRCFFEMPIPKSTSGVKTRAMLAGDIQHTKRPDLDNLCKMVKDCLNGLAWNDDSQVVKMIAAKGYSQTPRTVVEVLPFGKEGDTPA